MSLLRKAQAYVQYRGLLKILDRLTRATERQASALERLADRWAPIVPDPSPDDLRTSGPSYRRDEEQVRIQEFVDRFEAELHRLPSEEELLRFLDGQPV